MPKWNLQTSAENIKILQNVNSQNSQHKNVKGFAELNAGYKFQFGKHRFSELLVIALTIEKPCSFLPTHPAPLYCPSLLHNLLGPTVTTHRQMYAIIDRI